MLEKKVDKIINLPYFSNLMRSFLKICYLVFPIFPIKHKNVKDNNV